MANKWLLKIQYERHWIGTNYLKRLSYKKEWTKTTHSHKKKTKSPDNCLPYFGAIKKYARDRIFYMWTIIYSGTLCYYDVGLFVCTKDDDDDDDNDDNSVK